MQHLTLEFACRQIAELFHAHAEWLFVPNEGAPQSLRRDELEIAIVHGRLVFSCWTEKGTRWWHVLDWHWTGRLLEFETSRRLGRERAFMQLVPRASAKHVAVMIRVARELRCERLAHLAATFEADTRIERLSLNHGTRTGQPEGMRRFCCYGDENESQLRVQWFRACRRLSMRSCHRRCCGFDARRIASGRRLSSSSGCAYRPNSSNRCSIEWRCYEVVCEMSSGFSRSTMS